MQSTPDTCPAHSASTQQPTAFLRFSAGTLLPALPEGLSNCQFARFAGIQIQKQKQTPTPDLFVHVNESRSLFRSAKLQVHSTRSGDSDRPSERPRWRLCSIQPLPTHEHEHTSLLLEHSRAWMWVIQSSTGHAQTPGGGSSVNILSSFPSRAIPTPAIAVFKEKLAGVGGAICAAHERRRLSLLEGRW